MKKWFPWNNLGHGYGESHELLPFLSCSEHVQALYMYSNVFSIFPPAHAFEVTLPAARNRSAERKSIILSTQNAQARDVYLQWQNCEVKVTGLEARHWNLPKSEVQQPKHASPHPSCALGGGSPGFYIPGCKKSWLICHLIGQSPATRDATTELLSQLAFTSKSSGQHGGWVCLLTALMDSDPGHETEW